VSGLSGEDQRDNSVLKGEEMRKMSPAFKGKEIKRDNPAFRGEGADLLFYIVA